MTKLGPLPESEMEKTALFDEFPGSLTYPDITAALLPEAAERIFGLLGTGQGNCFLDLWQEFEERTTNDAKYAAVFDRLEPVLQNYLGEGYTWKKYGVTHEMVIEKNSAIKEGSADLWNFVRGLLEKAVERGYLAKGGKPPPSLRPWGPPLPPSAGLCPATPRWGAEPPSPPKFADR